MHFLYFVFGYTQEGKSVFQKMEIFILPTNRLSYGIYIF
jgi:hypothetical protein